MPETFNILLIGKGGREHALAWKLTRTDAVEHVYVVPGNGGTASMPNVTNVESVGANDYPGLVSFAKANGINLVVVGPDDNVVDGIEGFFRGVGIPCFAPSKEAAEVEGSKAYAKSFMEKYSIPTAEYRMFNNYDDAKTYLQTVQHRVVIKADGLAAGKGVILPQDQAEGLQALQDIMVNGRFGAAGDTVIVEEYLDGKEISLLTFSDGTTTRSLPPAQDHKRIFERNRGPNTGGMGVYAPVPFVTPEIMRDIEDKILKPTFEGLRKEGRPFVGMLFTGIMITSTGPKVLEYNARFGDPETQSLVLLIPDRLAEILHACATGTLDKIELDVLPLFACNVIVAANGYPDSYRKGDAIELGSTPPDVQIFHAGTVLRDGKLSTNGGRVLSVAASGKTLAEAISAAYEGVRSVKFEGMYYRRDIAGEYRE